jgi:glycosyltransferase involved in cell wall biosynthesis
VEREFIHRWGDFDVAYVHCNVFLASKVALHLPTVLRLPGPVTAELAPALRAVRTVCANGDALTRIREFLGDHAVELPVGLNEEMFMPGPSSVRRNLGWTAKHRVVGYVGRFTHIKGVDLLAAAFREIAQTIPDARLLIIGEGAAKRTIISLLANEISRRIVHIQSSMEHEKLPEWYRAMDLLALPSRYENFSNALLEGMACGIPFLASDVGGNKMMAKAGGGWLFEAGSVSSLAEYLHTLLRNDLELQARGRAAYLYVQSHHRWPVSAAILEKIIGSRLGVQ